MEGDNIIGLFDVTHGGAISLEPGGQFELSGAPVENVHQTASELMAHLAQVREVAKPLGIGFLGLGMTPNWTRADMPVMPKGRYKIMTAYMPKVGQLGLDMMYRTCTVQANLDFSSEADMVKKLRVSLALQPVATALFANSPFTEGKPNGYLSFRSHIWTDTDADRSGMLPWAFEDGMGFEARSITRSTCRCISSSAATNTSTSPASRSAISSPASSTRCRANGRPFPTGPITLSTIFPEVRLKRYLEMRGEDGGPWRRLPSLTAFWVGLLYDDDALDACWDMVKGWTAEQRQKLRDEVPQLGFRAEIGNTNVFTLAQETLRLATHGLQRRKFLDRNGRDETRYLRPLEEIDRARHHAGRGIAGKVFQRLESVGRADFRCVCVLIFPLPALRGEVKKVTPPPEPLPTNCRARR